MWNSVSGMKRSISSRAITASISASIGNSTPSTMRAPNQTLPSCTRPCFAEGAHRHDDSSRAGRQHRPARQTARGCATACQPVPQIGRPGQQVKRPASTRRWAATLRASAQRLYPPSRHDTMRPAGMALGDFLDAVRDPFVVGLDQAELAEVVVAVRVEAGRHEDHLRPERLQPRHPHHLDGVAHVHAARVRRDGHVHHVRAAAARPRCRGTAGAGRSWPSARARRRRRCPRCRSRGGRRSR